MTFFRLLRFTLLLAVMVMPAVPACSSPAMAAAEPSFPLISAFFVTSLPETYAEQERFFQALKDGGANTVVVRAPFDHGILNKTLLTNVVFLAHSAGMKLFVILPTRGNDALLAQSPEWEDLRYNIRSRSMERTGRLDLFQPAVINAVASTAKEVASFSVDALLFAEDFYYGETEGMSPLALGTYRQIFGSDFSVRKVFEEEDGSLTQASDRLGEPFWNMIDLKKNALINQFRAIAKAAWSVNAKIKLGLPLPVEGLMTPKDALAQFSYDMEKFKKLNIDYYWVDVRHRDIRRQQNLSYAKTMETVARIATSASSIINNSERTIMTVQTTDSGNKHLPLTEVEDAVNMLKHSGVTGIAFMVDAHRLLPSAMTRKVFSRED